MREENFLPKSVQSAEKGLVFNIQRFSLHDGPGIRTTVFLKGCPLRCLWCSNPESQDYQPNLIVRDIECRQCGACAEACSVGAIKLNKAESREINWERLVLYWLSHIGDSFMNSFFGNTVTF